ncbi:MAG: UDP-3-O-(3-hydroxymyristoyl)glucosamine N-acyltransferase [Gammaproteobacteria bacterium]|nr:UDP-3-O-(3-hydroxymyristoyl)glucosamine N-acyltransferase [Gammaproteobacteria bacterium]
MRFTLGELAEQVGGVLKGDPAVSITGIASLETAGPSDITFVVSKKYAELLGETRAGAVLVNKQYSETFSGNSIAVDNPHVAFARIAELFVDDDLHYPGVGPGAVIDESAVIGNNVSIGENVVIKSGVTVADGAIIGAGCYVGKNASIGQGSRLYPGVTVHHTCVVGARCILHTGCVIGGDGFGYAKQGTRWIKVPQLGKVILGDEVEIGTNTTVDRGALDDTRIGDRVKIDNLVQIGHNVLLGEDTIIAAGAGVAGSARIGKRCAFGGQCGIFGHLEITDDVEIAARSMVTKSIKKAGVYSSGIRVDSLEKWQKNAARLYQLDEMAKRIKVLENELKALKKE